MSAKIKIKTQKLVQLTVTQNAIHTTVLAILFTFNAPMVAAFQHQNGVTLSQIVLILQMNLDAS